MRIFLVFVLATNLAYAIDTTRGQATDQNKLANVKKQNAAQPTIIVNVAQPTKTKGEEQEEKKEREHKAMVDENLVKFTGQLADYTLWLALATIVLACGTLGLWWYACRQSQDTKKSIAVAKESADAAVNASKPFLFPRAVETHFLHPSEPIADGAKHDPKIYFIFENYGATPGVVKEVRADLFLSEVGGQIPPIPDVETLTVRRGDALIIIPGHTYWDAAENARSVIQCDFRALTIEELRQVAAEAKNVVTSYRRFFLIGRVIYNDFFGIQTTQTFCLKLRAHGFQSMTGGDAYNHATRDKKST